MASLSSIFNTAGAIKTVRNAHAFIKGEASQEIQIPIKIWQEES
jgi:hypothetical protein